MLCPIPGNAHIVVVPFHPQSGGSEIERERDRERERERETERERERERERDVCSLFVAAESCVCSVGHMGKCCPG